MAGVTGSGILINSATMSWMNEMSSRIFSMDNAKLEFLSKRVDIDFMFFTTDFIFSCLKDGGFNKIEIIERKPYPGVEYESRRAYVFAEKP